MKKDDLFIIEDEIYFDTKMINNSIICMSTAKDSQYYQVFYLLITCECNTFPVGIYTYGFL